MQLISFNQNGQTRIGALQSRDGQDAAIDLNQLDPRIPADVIAFLEGGAETHALATQALANADPSTAIELAGLKLKAPVPRPGKIICIGLNYRDHAEETNQPIPEYPTIFTKYANTVIAPGEPIVIPRVTDKVDYECELAVVIGKRGRYVAEDAALDYVAGYTALNDVSARDFQNRTSQWTIGKTFDTFAPLGPALVTTDEIPDPHRLSIRTVIDGEVLQNSHTSNLIFTVQHLVAYLSQVMTLEPGDVIATGTPAGVGFVRKPPRYLKAGDVVNVEIEKIGTLSNPVVAET